MASSSKNPKTISESVRNMPQINHKEQYESLLTESDTQPLDHQNFHTHSNKRSAWRSPFFYVPTILCFFLGMALVAVCSSNSARLDSVISQMEEKIASFEAISALGSSSHKIPLPEGLPPTHPKTSNPTGEEFGSCGHSPGEAQSLGCIFDPMSWAWQRPECYNAELINHFLNITDWHFYPNNATRPEEELPREVWATGGYNGAWGPWSWHMYHCSYSWRKFDMGFHHGKPLDDDILDPLHTHHCSVQIILRDTDPTLHAPCLEDPHSCEITQMWMKFNKCGYY
ncbi:hypothetical protein F4805DRAFT_438475 [Annulohypoxylon moriforme]|nr:hypothetical protein F4805DRAFT_438475 [Annulohypoxylon moriforme]